MSESPVVVVTGASSGIGERAALTLGSAGYRVVLAARRLDRLVALADQIREDGGQALAVPLDLARVEQTKSLVDTVLEKFGRIDILVNNAGTARHLWLDQQSLEKDIQNQIQINLIGMIQLTRCVLPGMREAGKGQIIHISSVASWVGIPTYSIYNACKFGARGFMSSLRRELRGSGVIVSEIYPGAVDTDFALDPEVKWKTRTVTPDFALVSAQDVADRILNVIRRKTRKTVIPGFMWLAVLLEAHFPWVLSWLLSKYFYIEEGNRYSWRERQS
jgi:short-subunit dehydrogenase